MAAQGLLHQISREVAAAATFLQRMALQLIHHSARQGDIDALGTGGISHGSTAGSWRVSLEALL